jgi:hypothetical protein
MAKLLKLRRGTTSQHSSFTGAEGEVTIDTTKDTAVVHDGSQAGGRPLAREDLNNVSSGTIAGRLGTDSIATSKIAGGALPSDVTVATANINNDAVSFAKLENIGTSTIVGRISGGTGNPEELSASQIRSILNVANGATNVTNNNQLTNGAGYVTSSGNTIIGTDSDINTSGATVIDQLNMTDGVIQSHTTRTLTLANLGYTGATNANYITNNNQLSNGAGYVTSSGNTVIGTDSDINTSGATVVDQLNMTDGVITSHSTRTITLANLGYSGATNANYITNNNQLNNGSGYITSSSLSSYMPKSGGEFSGDVISHNIRPDGNGTRALGTSSYRWSNLYTSDLSLSNEAYGGNDIDGTWGDWTIQEGESDLFLKNNRSGKKYKFNLTEVS